MVEYIDDVFEVTIKGGNVILTWPNGRCRAMPVATFRKEIAIASEALAKWQVEQLDNVVPLQR